MDRDAVMGAPVEVVFTPWPYDAVARGVALLDEKVPGWRKIANSERLITDPDMDPLSLYFGTYEDGCWELRLATSEGSDYGFDTPLSKPGTGAWDDLCAAWHEVIAGGAR